MVATGTTLLQFNRNLFSFLNMTIGISCLVMIIAARQSKRNWIEVRTRKLADCQELMPECTKTTFVDGYLLMKK
jgi:hypothetical protein